MIFRDLGRQPYVPLWHAMQRFTALRHATTEDEIWLLEHDPVYTQGMAGKPEHMLAPRQDIPVVAIDRGGQITYHGPGQLVVYFLLDVAKRHLVPRQLVHLIEQALTELLAHFNVEAYPRPDAPGVYVREAKIASIGLRIRKQGSYHGLSLNVAMDLTPFQHINPCGYAGMVITQMADLVPGVTLTPVKKHFQRILASVLA